MGNQKHRLFRQLFVLPVFALPFRGHWDAACGEAIGWSWKMRAVSNKGSLLRLPRGKRWQNCRFLTASGKQAPQTATEQQRPWLLGGHEVEYRGLRASRHVLVRHLWKTSKRAEPMVLFISTLQIRNGCPFQCCTKHTTTWYVIAVWSCYMLYHAAWLDYIVADHVVS